MKSFIVSLGLLIIMATTLCYAEDYNKFIHEQMHLKAVAEECAAGGMLEINQYEYSLGRIVVNKDDAVNYAWLHFKNYIDNICSLDVTGVEMNVWIYDHEGIYYRQMVLNKEDEVEILSENSQTPAMKIQLIIYADAIIRGGFINIDSLSRETVYELVLP